MPLLTRRGFIDITSLEVLADPSKEWGNLSRAIRKYNLPRYKGWGDLPRGVFPDYPNPSIVQKITIIQASSNAKVESEMAYTHNRNALIAHAAGQNMVSLASDIWS
jgi:hypothetical protein